MPDTKSFTLVKSTLFLPLGLTPLPPPAGTRPWERAGRPTNRRHLSPTSVAHLPSNHPAILCHSVKDTLWPVRCLGKTWSTQSQKETREGGRASGCKTQGRVKPTTPTAGLFHFSCDTSNLQLPFPRLIYVWIFDKADRVSALTVGAR